MQEGWYVLSRYSLYWQKVEAQNKKRLFFKLFALVRIILRIGRSKIILNFVNTPLVVLQN